MVDYSVWDHIEVSDDEDETHPNIDTASLFRWRHQVRLGRPALSSPPPSPPPQKHALMEQVAHQTIVMQFILELAKSLKVDPRACFRQFFTKIKTADQQYLEGFTEELEAFKERVRGRARARLEKALRDYEEEERQKRLGPGGLDPVDVYESLPAELQKCFDVKDVQMLQDTISKMDPTEAKYHMQRCIDSGLWVPNARGGEGAEKGAGEAKNEETKTENSPEDKAKP
ncbi:PREDICTED: hsp90 co-chaperone Cdc37 [Sturnus vulgaris]|uniref:hsp90 co-chaperone Cdc37 n=1 Tax=Sturnus vulgaris TaxID=9172 RepID=UPI00071A0AA0|nr:PREDICTED: hsp90 co-chaperone Cdc37 [Sturnus vulgaris]